MFAESKLGGEHEGKESGPDIPRPSFLGQGDSTATLACAAQEASARHLLRDYDQRLDDRHDFPASDDREDEERARYDALCAAETEKPC